MESNLTILTPRLSLFNTTLPTIVLVWIEIVAACITYGFGFIGNLLSLIIFFSQEEFRITSTGFLFLLMTISNTVHLWSLTTDFISNFNVNVYRYVFFQCRFNYFLQDISRAVSIYLAIGTTLDRLFRCEYPIRSRIICTRTNVAKVTFICVLIFSILFSFWFCPLNTLNPLTGTCYNGQSATYLFFFNHIFLPLRLILVCIIPVIIMCLANIRMLYNIRQSRRRVHNVTAHTISSGLLLRGMTPLDQMLFYMMLTSVGTFIITQIPFHIYTLVQANYSIYDAWDNALIRSFLLIWSSIFFGVGFYFYCLASPLFREKFLMMRQRIVNYVKGRPPI